jgi:SWI/SNF-related matrix-associated actin-dependent regulator 1 of chromatin subfamily A
LEDDDVEEEEETTRPSAVNRGRRFVVDDDDEDEEVDERERGGDLAEVYDIKSSDEEWEEEELAVEDDDLVGKALQKCSKISVELKRELYGSGVTSCDRYAEVEASSVKIVTQVLPCFHFGAIRFEKAEILFIFSCIKVACSFLFLLLSFIDM